MYPLTAGVIELASLTGPFRPGQNAREARTWLFDQVQTRDPKFVDDLKPAEQNNRTPITVSGLLRGENGIPYIRFTGMTAPASTAIENVVAHASRIRFGETDYEITKATCWAGDHLDAKRSSYAELINEAKEGRLTDKFSFRLLTPVAFRSSGRTIALPDAKHVFGSLQRDWEEFTQAALPVDIDPIIGTDVELSWFRLTSSVSSDLRRTVGSVGELTFKLAKRDKQTRARDLTAVTEMLYLLSCFSFFCGVGVSTSWGMGQVRFNER